MKGMFEAIPQESGIAMKNGASRASGGGFDSFSWFTSI
jgi:hypothetical protein